MKYGIENYSLASPFSTLVSIILILGLYRIGKLIFKFDHFKYSIENVSNLKFQYVPISLLIISVIIYPIILFIKIDNRVFYFISIVIALFGIWHIIQKLKIILKHKINKQSILNNWRELVVTIIIFSYFLLSLAPVTDADSLDYHISIPIYVINHGLFPKDILWFHSSQGGLGEVLIVLGLVLGAEQFSGLIQFSGLVSIFGILKKNINKSKSKKFVNVDKQYYLNLIFLSIPLLIFLNSTAKPQLIFIAYSTLAFSITFFDLSGKKTIKNSFKFFLITLLLYVSFEGKFSFILSAFIIWGVASFKILQRKNYKTFTYTLLIFLILSFPSFYWKFLYYGGNFINKIYFPYFPILDDYINLYRSINNCEFPCNKSLFLFPNSIGRYTESIGIAILSIIFILFANIKKNLLIILSIVFYLLILYNFGKFSARFILEPVIWSIVSLKYSKFNFDFKFSGLLKFYILSQAFLTSSSILVGIFTLSIGSLTPNLKNHILSNSAYGYDLAMWVNSNLDTSEKVIYSHRSISLPTLDVIPLDFLLYSENEIYLNLLKNKKPRFLILQSNSPKRVKKLISCTTGIFKKKENFFKKKSRNFLNKSEIKYSAYIYYFDHKKLPECYYK